MKTTFVCEPSEEETSEASRYERRLLLRIIPNRKLVRALDGFILLAYITVGIIGAGAINQVSTQHLKWLAASVAAAVLMIVARKRLASRALQRLIATDRSALVGRYTISIEDEGIRQTWARGETWYPWHAVSAIEKLRTVTLLFVGEVSYVLVSHSAFASSEEHAEFIAAVRERIATQIPAPKSEAMSHSGAALDDPWTDPAIAPDIPAELSNASNGWRSFGHNVLAGIKLAVFMRVPAEDIKASWSQLVGLMALGLALTFALDFAAVGMKGHFFVHALPDALFYVPLALVGAWGMAFIVGRPEQTLRLMVALLALAIPVEAVQSLRWAAFVHRSPWQISLAAYYILPVWLALAAGVAAVRILAIPFAMRGPVLIVAAVVLWLPQAELWRGRLWIEPYDEKGYSRSKAMALTSEEVLYLQPKLLERELAALKRGRKGVVDLYFVGVAGSASQDVFMKEVNSCELSRETEQV